ncbi:tyrosine-type recombinase/integrase [Roseomonas sp. BN140053]|uniref:tyrosine-type recombinase/integrase n=1 Tax=Roseomonas sp. BN140053 TaxID=3391898 RepID=UPI0039EB48E8
MSDQLPAAVPGTLPALQADLAERLAHSAHHARGTMAAETVRAWERGRAAFFRWCEDRERCALPAEPEVVADYVDTLALKGVKAATIRQAVWAITVTHRMARYPDPAKGEEVRLALKRMARQLGTRQRQAAPLGGRELERILATAGRTLPALRNVALVLTMSDLLARRSEAVALAMEDVQHAPDGSATALIRRSKTDQEGAGAVLWLSPRTVTALRQWTQAAGITEGAIFRAVNKAGRVGEPLTGGDVPRILKRLAEGAGLDPSDVSGHSCRVGTAQDMVAAGEDTAGIMQAGRWKSPTMPARYGERLAAGRGAVARLYERNRR